MISKNRKNIKTNGDCEGANPYPLGRYPWRWILYEIDCHPRLGWFWVALLAVNTILNILDLFGFGG